MSRIRVIVVFTLLALSCQSCDLFRKMAGRPTSADIEAKRQMIENERNAHQDRLDSLDIIQKQIADSLAVLDSIRFSDSRLIEARRLSEESRNSLEYRYYVIIAAFSNSDNAVKFAAKTEEDGYQCTFIHYLNGYTAIGICPTDNLAESYAKMREIRGGYCPEAWILDNRD